MKLCLDDFNVFNDMNTHLAKLRLCFNKCQTFGINLNPKKCMFMVFLEFLLDTLYSRNANYRIPKDIGHYQHVATKNPQGYASFLWCGLILSTLPSLWPPSPNSFGKPKHLNGFQSVKLHGKPSSKGTLMPRYSVLFVGIWNFMFIWMHPTWQSMPCWHKTQRANVINQWLMHSDF